MYQELSLALVELLRIANSVQALLKFVQGEQKNAKCFIEKYQFENIKTNIVDT